MSDIYRLLCFFCYCRWPSKTSASDALWPSKLETQAWKNCESNQSKEVWMKWACLNAWARGLCGVRAQSPLFLASWCVSDVGVNGYMIFRLKKWLDLESSFLYPFPNTYLVCLHFQQMLDVCRLFFKKSMKSKPQYYIFKTKTFSFLSLGGFSTPGIIIIHCSHASFLVLVLSGNY